MKRDKSGLWVQNFDGQPNFIGTDDGPICQEGLQLFFDRGIKVVLYTPERASLEAVVDFAGKQLIFKTQNGWRKMKLHTCYEGIFSLDHTKLPQATTDMCAKYINLRKI